MSQVRNVALVHGGFVDGSGWEGVYHLLKQDGFNVSVVQNPTLSLEDDDAVTRRVLDKQDGPTILVGHSYGGAVITEAGTHEKVAGLVYIAAFVPDQGESVNSLIAGFPTDGAPAADPAAAGRLPAPRPREVPCLVRGRPERRAGRVHGRLAGPVGPRCAWRHDQRRRLAEQAELGTSSSADDHMIPPPAQRTMAERAGATVTETPGSHAVYVSNPKAVANLIAQAARSAVPEGALA